jgi:hypothetical protein
MPYIRVGRHIPVELTNGHAEQLAERARLLAILHNNSKGEALLAFAATLERAIDAGLVEPIPVSVSTLNALRYDHPSKPLEVA